MHLHEQTSTFHFLIPYLLSLIKNRWESTAKGLNPRALWGLRFVSRAIFSLIDWIIVWCSNKKTNTQQRFHFHLDDCKARIKLHSIHHFVCCMGGAMLVASLLEEKMLIFKPIHSSALLWFVVKKKLLWASFIFSNLFMC